MSQPIRKCALFAALTAAVLLAHSASAAPRIYVQIDGTRQGTLQGNSPIEGRRNKSEVLRFAYAVTLPTTTISGARTHSPIRITKVVGPASPQLFQALTTNEQLSRVQIDFLAMHEDGTEYLANSIKLTNARVVGIEQFTEEPTAASPAKLPSSDARNLETISFTFQTIEVTNYDAQTTATDSLATR